MENDKFLSTGDFAKICNVTKQTLFHYDQIGLLEPHHKAENGYRYYSYQQFDIMYMIESLKEIGMSLAEIKQFMSITTPEIMVETFKEKSNRLAEKIESLQRVQKAIAKKIAITEQAIQEDFSSIYLEQVEEHYLYLSDLVLNCSNQQYTQAVSKLYSTCVDHKLNEGDPIGVMIHKEQLLQGDATNLSYLFVKVPYTDKVPLYKIAKGKQVVGYHIGHYEQAGETYNKLLGFIQQHGLSIIDFSFEEYIWDGMAVQGIEQFVTKIMIPVA